ncbi:MAG: hypothetical protein SFU87_01440 [Chitinophagaceae bacterium]|nr:hypothetical protein [Chitinophagaceae bacterium]
MAVRLGLPGFRMQAHPFKVSFPTSSYVKIDMSGPFRRLLLDNFTYGPVLMQPSVDWTRGASFIFLKNTAK